MSASYSPSIYSPTRLSNVTVRRVNDASKFIRCFSFLFYTNVRRRVVPWRFVRNTLPVQTLVIFHVPKRHRNICCSFCRAERNVIYMSHYWSMTKQKRNMWKATLKNYVKDNNPLVFIITNMTLTVIIIFTIMNCHISVFQMTIVTLSKFFLTSIIFIGLHNFKWAGIAQSV